MTAVVEFHTEAAGKAAWDRWGWWSGVAAVLGFADALYLTWLKLAHATAACAGIGNCELVNNSRFASISGIPIAAFGAAAYAAILFLLVLDRRSPSQRIVIRTGLFGITLAGALYSLYLTYLEVAVLHAICPFCVLSAIAMLALFTLSILRLRTVG